MNKEKTDFHGGNIYKIFREKNMDKILDYSSNINPYGLPENLKKEIFEKLFVLERYPDPDYIELREKIAEKNNLNIENIIVGNGATEIIFLFMKILSPKKVLIVSPTFGEYERAIKASTLANDSLEINYFELKETENFVLNVKNLETELENNYDLLILCNPNNPTGQFLKLKKLEEILKICEQKNTKLFVDEAFVEFVEDWENESIINSKENKENLFVIRAFTKFFAIPGLRLGYGICFNNNLLKKMLEKKEPWSVNNIADLAGKTVLDDENYIQKTKEWIKDQKKYMYENLNKIEGLRAYKTEVNFILLKIEDNLLEKGLDVKNLRKKMLEKGILIRDASNFIYLNKHYFRLAIKDKLNNEKVIETLTSILKKYKKKKKSS
ncbi:threonine-phosphate decarboxylase CobD [Leptotrichia sp. oral taxon 221]|uniref:threonine-phosphate decarboxylase CobD n=1 Tax=Leptotrichia sp. oral taxon 221 TaxID=712362 RepID=UPI001B8BA252|nr:threonine-phosphate decarboxylase CobD [Leptotrichia sp. oral taxon 221]QUB97523.1 threonine-phosphate decarboxylase [Leptotrichia sp. oral taxon 221]